MACAIRQGGCPLENMRKTRKLPEQIADKLREMIIEDNMQTGSKLPAEAELMNRFGVSRSTVREAVKILQTEHIVDIRQGQGTFLCAMTLSMEFSRQEYWSVGSYSLLWGIFLTQAWNLGLLHCRQILYCLSHQRSMPMIYS